MEDCGFHQKLVINALVKGPLTTEELVHQCEGMFPLELMMVLEGLVDAGHVRLINQGYCLDGFSSSESASSKVQVGEHEPTSIELPEPHPCDFDWRFDDATADRLIQAILDSLPRDGHLLLLGTPSLFAAVARLGRSAPSTTLVDWNQALQRVFEQQQIPPQMKFVCLDLLNHELPTDIGPVDTVVCDPPWYTEYYELFLGRATKLLKVGGLVFVSLLPVNARPGANDDRARVLKSLEGAGLHPRELRAGVLGYETPPFEKRTLIAAGYTNRLTWRHGDLLTLWKVGPEDSESMRFIEAIPTDGPNEIWFEVVVGRSKVKLRGPFEDIEKYPELVRIEPGDVLPTVSRRYAGRAQVDLWLGDNRVYGARGKAAFRSALRAVSGTDDEPSPPWLVTPEFHEQAMAILCTIGLNGTVDLHRHTDIDA